MYFIIPRATTKKYTKRYNEKLSRKLKWNTKKYSTHPKQVRKRVMK